MNDVRKGDAVCWLKCILTPKNGGESSIVIAPVVPFPMGKRGHAPEVCQIVDMTLTNNRSELRIVYGVDRNLRNTVSKFYGADSFANKGMIDAYDVIKGKLTLKNGALLDAIVAAATTGGRKEGTDNRLKTMYSMMAVARAENYNLAFCPSSFPSHPELKTALQQGVVEMSVWKDLLKPNEIFPFTGDPDIDALLTHDCLQMMYNGHNPSHLLATYFVPESGNPFVTGYGFEYDALLIPTIRYEDKFLKWMHYMDIKIDGKKGLSPNGINDKSREYLFALKRENGDIAAGFDRGILQMELPFQISPNKVSYVWNNTYVGYSEIGKDTTADTSPNVNNAAAFPDANSMGEQMKLPIPEHIRRQLANRGVSDFGHIQGSRWASQPMPIGVNGFAFLEDDDTETPMTDEEFVNNWTERIKQFLDGNVGSNDMSGFGAILSVVRKSCIDRGLTQDVTDTIIDAYYKVGSRVILSQQ